MSLQMFQNKIHVYDTCPHKSLVALHAEAGLIQTKHGHVVGLSAPQAAQIAVGRGVVAFRLMASVFGDTHRQVREGSTGLLPRHCSQV